jgi:serine/threonine-protein phosphatase 2B catalytic subunit
MYKFFYLGLSKYNQVVYDEIMNVFDQLPIAAVIDKKYFAVHGGISPNCIQLEDIQRLDRFR